MPRISTVQWAAVLVCLTLAAFAHTATVSGVQSGTATSNGNGTLSVALGQPVDPSRSVLFFSTRHASAQPGNATVRGRLADASTVEFVRATDDPEPLEISWYLVEFASGVRVQRGQVAQSGNTLNVSLAQPVASTQQAFLLYSKTPAAGDSEWGSNDPIGGYVRTTSSLRFRTDADGSHIIDYQVVEFIDPADILVQSGEVNVSNNDDVVDVNLPQDVDPANTFVLAGHTINNHSVDYDDRLFRGEVVDDDTIRFTRETTGNDVGRLVWQAVELRDGSRVMHGTTHLPYSLFSETMTTTVSLPQTVDTGRSVAFASMQSYGGQSMGSSGGAALWFLNDVPGNSSFTFEFEPPDDASDQLRITRSEDIGAADVGWFVIEFNDAPPPAPDPVLDVAMNELSWNGTPGEVADQAAGNDGIAQGGADTLGADPAIAGNPGTCRYGDFDGTNDYLVFDDGPHLDIEDELTVAIWINARTLPGSGLKSIVSKDTNYEFHVDDADRIYWWWNDTAGNVRSFAGGTVSANTWHHVAVTYTSGMQKIYLDGAEVASEDFNGSLADNDLDLQVGQDQAIAERFWDGHLDELRIYHQELDAGEIQDVMNATRPCALQPVGDWHFDESGWNGTAGEVVDHSGNDHHGRAVNTTTDGGLVCNAADLGANGTSDWLELDHAAFDGVEDFTLAVWYRGTQSSDMSLVSGANGSSLNELIYWIQGADRFNPHLHSNSAGGTVDISAAINDGGWHFLAWRRSGAESCLYVDDALAGCVNRPTGAIDIDPGGLIVGQEQDSVGGGFVGNQAVEGDLDELLLFDRPLSPADLAAIRANHLAGQNWDGTARDCPVLGVAGFVINHDGAGIHCADEAVQVTAADASGAVVAGYSGQVTLDTGTGRGSWSLVSGNGALADSTPDDGLATYLFDAADNGTVTVTLSYPEGAQPVNVDVHQSDDPTLRDDDSEGLLTFAPSGFTVTANPLPNPPPSPMVDPIPTQVAGTSTPFDLHITAYGVTEDDPQCGVIESYGGPRMLSFSMSHVNPGPAPGPRLATVDDEPVNGGPQSVTFTSGQAQVPAAYKDAGAIRLDVQDAGSFSHALSGGTNSFVVRPAELVVSRVQSGSGTSNPGASSPTGPGFVPAGEFFEMDVEARDSDGDVTPSYGQENVDAEGVRVVLASIDVPSSGGVGSLMNGTLFSPSGMPGRFTGSSIAFDEVGSIRVTAEVADGDYLGTGPVTGALSGFIGRFHPAYFDLASASVSPGCGSFTYMGQPALRLQYRLQALNTSGAVTRNYDAGLLGSDAVADVSHVAEASDAGVDLGGRLSPVGGVWAAGEVVVDRSDLVFARQAAPDGPFDPLQLGVVVNDDLDSVPLLGLDANPDTSGNCLSAGNCSARNLGTSTRMLYGRLAVLPTSGPENEHLAVPLAAQMYTGAAFEHNPADACSTYAAGGMSLAGYTGNLTSGDTSVIAPAGSATLSGGVADSSNPPTLAAPGFGHDGSVDVRLDVDAWLEFDWLGSGATDPAATASFGRFRGHDRIIYWSEPR